MKRRPPSPLPEPPPRQIYTRPPNSVWQLALSRQQLAAWPPKFPAGRQFIPLGPWYDPEHDKEWSAAE